MVSLGIVIKVGIKLFVEVVSGLVSKAVGGVKEVLPFLRCNQCCALSVLYSTARPASCIIARVSCIRIGLILSLSLLYPVDGLLDLTPTLCAVLKVVSKNEPFPFATNTNKLWLSYHSARVMVSESGAEDTRCSQERQSQPVGHRNGSLA
jgi:hypothetical protein